MTVGGLAMATNGGSGATAVGLLAAVIAVLLGYRSRRIRRAARAVPS